MRPDDDVMYVTVCQKGWKMAQILTGEVGITSNSTEEKIRLKNYSGKGELLILPLKVIKRAPYY